MINDLMDLALEEMESNLVQLKAELPSIRSTGQFALPERRQGRLIISFVSKNAT